jgi:AcrR family transcriptional regulator
VPRQDTGRVNQKRRTEAALVQATAELLRRGHIPTIAEAAEAALVSRRTAYRYFPNQQALLVEVCFQGPMAALEFNTRERLGMTEDPETRVDAVADVLASAVLEDEAPFRALVRVLQDGWFERRVGSDAEPSPLRPGRRVTMVEEALAPLRAQLSADAYRRLCVGVSVVIGMEAVIVVRDIFDLQADSVRDVLRWAARAMVRCALIDGASSSGH